MSRLSGPWRDLRAVVAVAGVGRTAGWRVGRSWAVVEGYAELDLDLPAGDADVLDDETHELLAFVEAEFVDAGCGTLGEVGHSAAELVVGGELVALGDQSFVLFGEERSGGRRCPGRVVGLR